MSQTPRNRRGQRRYDASLYDLKKQVEKSKRPVPVDSYQRLSPIQKSILIVERLRDSLIRMRDMS